MLKLSSKPSKGKKGLLVYFTYIRRMALQDIWMDKGKPQLEYEYVLMSARLLERSKAVEKIRDSPAKPSDPAR